MTSTQPPSVLHLLMTKTDHMDLLDSLDILCLSQAVALILFIIHIMFSRLPEISSKDLKNL